MIPPTSLLVATHFRFRTFHETNEQEQLGRRYIGILSALWGRRSYVGTCQCQKISTPGSVLDCLRNGRLDSPPQNEAHSYAKKGPLCSSLMRDIGFYSPLRFTCCVPYVCLVARIFLLPARETRGVNHAIILLPKSGVS